MSAELISRAWKVSVSPHAKLLLLAIADNGSISHDNRSRVVPSGFAPLLRSAPMTKDPWRGAADGLH